MKSRCSCFNVRFESQRPSHVFEHSSLPSDRRNSSSSDVNFAIDIDFTRCGGVRPRLQHENKRIENMNLCKIDSSSCSTALESFHLQCTRVQNRIKSTPRMEKCGRRVGKQFFSSKPEPFKITRHCHKLIFSIRSKPDPLKPLTPVD